MKLKAYLAGPWFTDGQAERLQHVENTLRAANYNVFSPKNENLWKPGEDKLKIVKGNCDAINTADIIIVITDGKDVGTMWEAGYAYALGKPILYVWLSHAPKQKFNIMLAATGALALSINELTIQLQHYTWKHSFIECGNEDIEHE